MRFLAVWRVWIGLFLAGYLPIGRSVANEVYFRLAPADVCNGFRRSGVVVPVLPTLSA